jgi:hypothetical protein
MRTVKGRYDGKVVVLDESVPVNGTVDVEVHFPSDAEADTVPPPIERRYWDNAREVASRFYATASDEVLRQRGRFDVTPSGLPEHLPSDEEWKERAERAVRLMREWQQEEPSDDLATREELEAGLEQHPVQFRRVRIDE